MDKLIDYKELYQVWGYRTSSTGAHERFEERTHKVALFQDFSDMLFRNLQQVCEYNQTFLFRTDTFEKIDKCKSTMNIIFDLETFTIREEFKERYEIYREIINEFWSKEKELLKKLKNCDNIELEFFIDSVKVLFYIKNNKIEKLYNLLKDMKEEEEEEEEEDDY